MSSAKSKTTSGQSKRLTTIGGKLAAMANASNDASDKDVRTPVDESESGQLSMDRLIEELAKQRASIKEDMIKSITPLQTSVDALRETVSSFQNRLSRVEVTTGENFASITKAESTISQLEKDNAALRDRVDDLENRSRRANLRIINVPEGSENGQDTIQFISKMLLDIMGPEVFDKAPELERAHRSFLPKPKQGAAPRAFVVCFHRFQDKERALRWSRQHELRYQNKVLRIYPDFSAALTKKRAAFNEVKANLYRKGVRFGLLFPARLRVTLKSGETFTFDSAERAMAFYKERFAD